MVAAMASLMLPPEAFNPWLFDIGAIVIISAVVMFFRFSQNSSLRGYWLKPSNLFLIGYLAVNFQYLLDYRIGMKGDGSRYILDPSLLNICLLLGICGLLAFIIGYTFRKNTTESSDIEIQNFSDHVPYFFIGLQLVLFVLFIVTINISDFISGSAFVDNSGHSSYEGLLYLANVLIVLLVSYNYRGGEGLKEYILSFPKASLLILVVYMILRMLSGDRGPFIYTSLLLLYGYLYATRKKWSVLFVTAALGTASLFIILLGMARLDDLDMSFGERIQSAFVTFNDYGKFGDRGENSVFGLTDELGFSFIVNEIDVQAIVKEHENYHYGTYQLFSILNAIPYMPGFLANTLHIKPENLSSSGFANYKFFGGYDRTWGIGTTCLGDFYLDLGILGVILGFFLVGKFFFFIDEILFVRPKSNVGLIILLIVLLYASQSVYIPRSVFLLNLQKVFLGVIVLYLYQKFIYKNR